MSRAVNLQRTFDDLALMQQGVVLEPLLQAISDLLDDHEGLITTIQGDLQRGLKNLETGRKGSRRRRSCARWFSCVSRTGITANCANGSLMD